MYARKEYRVQGRERADASGALLMSFDVLLADPYSEAKVRRKPYQWMSLFTDDHNALETKDVTESFRLATNDLPALLRCRVTQTSD